MAEESAKASATSLVPLAKQSISNTPIGPFHRTVLASLMMAENSSMALSPMSMAMPPSGTLPPSAKGAVQKVSAPSSNFMATRTSAGSRNFTPLALAAARISRARSSLSPSILEAPRSYPSAARNVLAMAPPIRNVSAFSISLESTSILSDTLAPPIITTKGFSGFSSLPSRYSSSRSIRKPMALFSAKCVTPSVEA